MNFIDFTFTHFKNVVAFDFEYSQTPGNNPKPVCCTFKNLKTGELITHWYLSPGPQFPFNNEDTLFIAHNAVAEVSCMLALEKKPSLKLKKIFIVM